MRKILAWLFMATLLLTSCAPKDSGMQSERAMARDSFEKIIHALEAHDNVALKSLFSEKSLQEAENMNAAIQDLFESYAGNLLTYEDGAGPSVYFSNNADGRGFKFRELRSIIHVETSENKYHFAFKEVVLDTEFQNNVGIYSLYIVETDNLNEPIDAWLNLEDGWMPGIHFEAK